VQEFLRFIHAIISRQMDLNAYYQRLIKKARLEGRQELIKTRKTKICPRCKKRRKLNQFHHNASRADGRMGHCKFCRNLYMREFAYYKYHLKKAGKLKRTVCCAICRNRYAAVLDQDHDHKTQKFRGFLCRRCNVGLGMFMDNVGRLKRAIAYLNTRRK